MRVGDYTLLVDESGFDEDSKRVMYVGCLFETAAIPGIEESIRGFNKSCLEDPFYSCKPGLVNSEGEPRHFTDDNVALQSRFIEQVVHSMPCRVYVVLDKPKSNAREGKVELFKKFISYVTQVREIKRLRIIIEKSGRDDRYLEQCGAVFRTKEFLPLGITDYFGGILHRFHEKRLEDLETGRKLTAKDFNGLAYNHYSILVDRISFEADLSTGEKSSRKHGRYFLRQMEDIIGRD